MPSKTMHVVVPQLRITQQMLSNMRMNANKVKNIEVTQQRKQWF